MNKEAMIRPLSDIHGEFVSFTPEQDSADIIVLAGDINLGVRGVEWAKKNISIPVVYVPGNHEFYGGHLDRTLTKMREAAKDSNVFLLDRDSVVIHGIRFLGATAWTDYSATGNVPLAEWDARQSMNDFRKIRIGSEFRKIRTNDLALRNQRAKSWLIERLDENFDGQTVVVTHHAPTLASLSEVPERGTHLDASYANRWENLMGEKIALWIHGHTHMFTDHEIGGTRIVANPRGYPGEETGFLPSFSIPIATGNDN